MSLPSFSSFAFTEWEDGGLPTLSEDSVTEWEDGGIDIDSGQGDETAGTDSSLIFEGPDPYSVTDETVAGNSVLYEGRKQIIVGGESSVAFLNEVGLDGTVEIRVPNGDYGGTSWEDEDYPTLFLSASTAWEDGGLPTLSEDSFTEWEFSP